MLQNTKKFTCSSVQESRLKLPVKADYIEAVLEYLYSDEVRSLAKSEDTEFISNVLVVADQFLLTRLKVPVTSPLIGKVNRSRDQTEGRLTSTFQLFMFFRVCLIFILIKAPSHQIKFA